MKKIVGVVLLTLSPLLCLVGLQLLKNASFTNLLYKNNSAILIRADNGEEKLLSYITEKYKDAGVTISRYINVDDKRFVIYTNDFSLDGKIAFTAGNAFDDDNFIANYDSGSDSQLDKFYLFGTDMEITIFPISQINYAAGTNGLYYVNAAYAEQVINEINDGVGFAELYDNSSINIDSYIANCFEMLISILMITIILILSIVHYMIRKSRKIAILKIQGLSVNMIFKNILNEFIFTEILIFIIGLLGLSFYGMWQYGTSSLLDVFKIYLVSFFLSNLIFIPTLYLILATLKLFGKTVPMLKGEKPYKAILFLHMVLKGIFLFVLLVNCINLAQNLNDLKVELNNLKAWENAKNVYSIRLNYVAESRAADKKLKQLYEKLEQQGAFLIDVENYEMVDEKNHLYDYNAPGEQSYYDPSGRTIIVNVNYLRKNKICTYDNTEPVEDKLVYDDNVRNILVPEKLHIYEDEIKKRFTKDFYFQKVRVENIYNEDLGLPLNTTSINSLSINIIYIKDGLSHFTYNDYVESENGCQIEDPIMVVETGNVDYNYYTSYLSRCVYFKYDGLDAFNYILPAINKTDTLSEINGVLSVYDEHGKMIYNMHVEIDHLITALFVVAVLFLISGYLTVSSYLQEKKYPLYIKKVFGFGLVQRIYIFALLLLGIDLVVLGIVAFWRGGFVIPIGAAVIAADMILLFAEANHLDKNNFNLIIKGEH